MTIILVGLVLIVLFKTRAFHNILSMLEPDPPETTIEDIERMIEKSELEGLDKREEWEIDADEIIKEWEESCR